MEQKQLRDNLQPNDEISHLHLYGTLMAKVNG